jgi:hypothetical protein
MRGHPSLEAESKAAVQAVRAILSSPEGRILLELLENSTTLALLPVISDASALVSRNAQALIASDLRRIMSNELDDPTDQLPSADRPVAGRRTR